MARLGRPIRFYSDTGGAIPAFLANGGSRTAIRKVFAAIRKEVAEPKISAVLLLRSCALDVCECRDAGNLLTQDQEMDILCAFVSLHAFKVTHMAEALLVIEDPYAPQDISGGAGSSSAISTLFIFAIEMW